MYLLTQLLGKPVKIIENKTQYSIRNIEDHSVVLDALIEDEEHNIYDVEVQIGDKDNHERRLRYYRTAIDWSYLEKSADFSKLPDVYMIFISDFDPFGKNKIHYEIGQYVKEIMQEYDSGVHIHYFNTSADEEAQLAGLMKYMADSDADNSGFGALSQQVKYHKIQNEGVEYMSSAFKSAMYEYGNEREIKGRAEGEIKGRAEGMIEGEKKGKIEAVKNMLKKNMSFETALELAGIDRRTYEEFAAAER